MTTLRCFTYILHRTVDRCQYSSAPECGRHIEQTLERIHTGGLVLALGIEVQLAASTARMLGVGYDHAVSQHKQMVLIGNLNIDCTYIADKCLRYSTAT